MKNDNGGYLSSLLTPQHILALREALEAFEGGVNRTFCTVGNISISSGGITFSGYIGNKHVHCVCPSPEALITKLTTIASPSALAAAKRMEAQHLNQEAENIESHSNQEL